jgi:tungstate transport system substrate-binding protein
MTEESGVSRRLAGEGGPGERHAALGSQRRPRVLQLPGLLSLMVMILFGFMVGGCGDDRGDAHSTVGGGGSGGVDSDLFVASTTSLQDSGLFDSLLPEFERAHPEYTVKVVAVGSGEALRLGETGDADVLLVHSPEAEESFMERGLGLERRLVMSNDFVIVGPPADPAGIKGLHDAAAAFARIAASRSLFFSRGDESGTYREEVQIWKRAAVTPRGDWYQTTGQGMGETLTIAAQKAGYTLTDRATYLAKRSTLALAILVEGDADLRNLYHVIIVKEARNLAGARTFAEWVTGEEAGELIGDFGRERFGEPLFRPEAGAAE